MANTKTVGASGKDYTTIGGALTWMVANHDFDTDGIATISIEDNGEYNEKLNVTGFTGTPSITAYLKFTVPSANRHSGVYGTGHARVKNTSAGHVFTLSTEFTMVEYLQVEQASSGSSDEGFRVTGNKCLISRNIIRCANITQQDGIYPNLANGEVIYTDNNVFIEAYRGGINQQTSTTSTVYSDFNTLIECGVRQDSQSGCLINQSGSNNTTFVVNNTVGLDSRTSGGNSLAFRDNATATWSGDYNVSAGGNASDDSAVTLFGATNNWGSIGHVDSAPASGSNVWTNDRTTSPYDVGIAGDNAYCVSVNGTDRVGSEPDARQDFSIDIVGNARDGTTPTIGAFEYVVAGAGAQPIIGFKNTNTFRHMIGR